MRKFKHTNTGIIGEVKDYHLYFERCHGELCSQESISMELIENSKDWVEIPMPTYEILSFKDELTNKIFELNFGNYCNGNEYLPTPLTTYTINSVKRLKDDKIFRLGDTVFFSNNTFIKWEIDNFFINKNNDILARSKDNQMIEVLSSISKVDPVVFTSEDGKELTEKDEFWVVTTNKFNLVGNRPHTFPDFSKDKSKYLRFSSLEAANEFRKIHKPCLSLIDFQNAFYKIGYYNADQGDKICDLADELKKIVKERL